MFTNSSRANVELGGARPQALRVDLDAHDGVDDEDRRLADAQRAERVGHEARLARRVEQVDLADSRQVKEASAAALECECLSSASASDAVVAVLRCHAGEHAARHSQRRSISGRLAAATVSDERT
jgi:cell wall assembly regulator SMI1